MINGHIGCHLTLFAQYRWSGSTIGGIATAERRQESGWMLAGNNASGGPGR